jgi:hypothetical protein
MKHNIQGTLTIKADALRVQPNEGSASEIKVSSIQDVGLGRRTKN